MMLDNIGQAERRPGHVATLPMKALPRFTPQDLQYEVWKMIETSGVEVEIVPSLTTTDCLPANSGVWSRAARPPVVGLNLNGVIVAVTGYDRPAYAADEIARLDESCWPRARAEIGRCRAHVEVAEVRARISQDLDENHDRALAVTIVAVAVSRLVEVEGIVWHASRCCLPLSGVARIAADLDKDVAPVELWIGLDRFRYDDGQAGVSTRGLFQLLGAEIEVGQTGFPNEVAFDIALDLAERIVADGALPEHGARLSFGLGRDFVVRHMPRGLGIDTPALSLTPEVAGQVAGAA